MVFVLLFYSICVRYTKKMPQIGHVCEPCWEFERV